MWCIETLKRDPSHFVYVVVTLILSIVLHELAHGWAAIWQGDRTPITSGHMTIDPRVHMGPISLVMVLVMGMGFGAMPVDPSRFRSRYGDALVAAAGPLMNLLLAAIAITALSIWIVSAGGLNEMSVQGSNLAQFLWVFGITNVALFLFNLIPLPPLDGSTVLANLHKGYARMIRNVQDPRMFLVGFVVLLLVLESSSYGLFDMAGSIAGSYMRGVLSVLS